MNEKIVQRMYVTKFALTSGVYALDLERFAPDDSGRVYWSFQDGAVRHFYREGTECFPTEEAARAHVGTLRDQKIKAVEKQLAKLKAIDPANLEFPVVSPHGH
jgi:hypothetical protein